MAIRPLRWTSTRAPPREWKIPQPSLPKGTLPKGTTALTTALWMTRRVTDTVPEPARGSRSLGRSRPQPRKRSSSSTTGSASGFRSESTASAGRRGLAGRKPVPVSTRRGYLTAWSRFRPEAPGRCRRAAGRRGADHPHLADSAEARPRMAMAKVRVPSQIRPRRRAGGRRGTAKVRPRLANRARSKDRPPRGTARGRLRPVLPENPGIRRKETGQQRTESPQFFSPTQGRIAQLVRAQL
jgi:hypothetical protein